MTSEVSYPSYY